MDFRDIYLKPIDDGLNGESFFDAREKMAEEKFNKLFLFIIIIFERVVFDHPDGAFFIFNKKL